MLSYDAYNDSSLELSHHKYLKINTRVVYKSS